MDDIEEDEDITEDINIDKINKDFIDENVTEDNLYDSEIIEYDEIIKSNYLLENKVRVSDNYITNYEKVRILGIRTQQILKGSKVMLKLKDFFNWTPYELAKIELENKTTPLIIKRVLPNNTYDLWKINELSFINESHDYIKNNEELFNLKKNIYTF